MNDSKTMPQEARKVFKKLGTCSRTFFYLLNREFGQLNEAGEIAADPLCGGLMQQGRQCGMLWGASLAVGAESFRRCDDTGKAACMAITATQHLMKSFENTAGSVDCKAITHCNLTSKWGMLKLIIFKARLCLRLTDDWAPEAIRSAVEGLSGEQNDCPSQAVNCASLVAEKMGASDEEKAMVAGFAGGMGLSGNACGALSAAIWMNSLAWCRKNEGKPAYSNPNAKNTLNAFFRETGSKILCREIAGQSFKSVDEHTEFMKNGGCDKLINVLALS